MNHLWAPWRMPYIEAESDTASCILCQLRDQPDGPDNLVVHRGDQVFIVLNRFPYTNGHLMVVPNEHQAELSALPEDTLGELMRLTSQSVERLKQAYGAEASNIGLNLGRAAGAGIDDHLHIHVVPRWSGDTNFMATTAATRVLPEALETTYQRLRQAWENT